MRKVILITTALYVATLLVVFTAMPAAVFAGNDANFDYKEENETTREQGYVKCGDLDQVTKDLKTGAVTANTPDGIVDNPCGFKDIITLTQGFIMGWIIFGVASAAACFAYAGYLYITAMGSEEKIRHAHSIFMKVVWGFVFMLSAWLIVATLEAAFLRPEFRDNFSFLEAPPED